MDYFTGVRRNETLEIGELLKAAKTGQNVRVNGAVHTIRDMGNVAFVILRKREGLIQSVYEKGIADFDLKEIKEAAVIEIYNLNGQLVEKQSTTTVETTIPANMASGSYIVKVTTDSGRTTTHKIIVK